MAEYMIDSYTVSVGSKNESCGQYPMTLAWEAPRRLSSSETSPELTVFDALDRCDKNDINVVFPEPDGPMIPVTRPTRASPETPSSRTRRFPPDRATVRFLNDRHCIEGVPVTATGVVSCIATARAGGAGVAPPLPNTDSFDTSGAKYRSLCRMRNTKSAVLIATNTTRGIAASTGSSHVFWSTLYVPSSKE